MNFATVILCVALTAAVVAVCVRLCRDRKRGKSTCGCQCSSCALGGCCHKN